MQILSNQRVADILGEYGVSADPKSPLIAPIQSYISLLLHWNRSISLTTITIPEEIVRFHFGESLFAVSVVPITGGRLADVGTGAGFPGLPLKMLVPNLDLTLIESNAKRSAFLEEVRRRLELSSVRILRGRMEDFERRPGDDSSPEFDFVTARAFGQFDELLGWSAAHLAHNGRIVLWLGEKDVASISKKPDWVWEPVTRIPGSRGRYVLTGSRQK